MIRLRFLGSLQVTDAAGGEVRPILAQPKRLALLAYLAITNRLHRRDHLVALFWPELDDEHARGALSQAVTFLRREISRSGAPSPFVSRNAEEIGIDSALVWSDTTAFVDALKRRQYAEALELYRGDLLDGFHVNCSAEFDEWMESDRSRWRDAAAKAALSAAAEYEARGMMPAAVASARRACDLSHPDEIALRQLLELLERLGDRSGALYAYQSFAERIARDLDAHPSPETIAIIERIRSACAPDDDARSANASGIGSPSEQLELAQTDARGIAPWMTRRSRLAVAAVGALMAAFLAIAIRLNGNDSPTTTVSTRHRGAIESYLRGNAAFARRKERAASFDALRGYAQAVALDSTFAEGWAGVARAHAWISWHALDPLTDHEKPAQAALERARRLAPSHSATQRAIGEVLFHTAGPRRVEEARQALHAAYQRDSSDSELLAFLAQVELRAERVPSAVGFAERAMVANPRDESATSIALTVYAYARRMADARRIADRLVLQDPDDPDSYLLRAMVAVMEGDTGAVRLDIASAVRELGNKTLLDAANWAVYPLLRIDASLAAALDAVPVDARVGTARMEYYWMAMHRAGARRQPSAAKAHADSIVALSAEIERTGRAPRPLWVADALIVLGRTSEALALADETPRVAQAPWPAYEWARIYAAAGRRDHALTILERLVQRPSYVTPALLRVDPAFVALRGEARFARLVAPT